MRQMKHAHPYAIGENCGRVVVDLAALTSAGGITLHRPLGVDAPQGLGNAPLRLWRLFARDASADRLHRRRRERRSGHGSWHFGGLGLLAELDRLRRGQPLVELLRLLRRPRPRPWLLLQLLLCCRLQALPQLVVVLQLELQSLLQQLLLKLLLVLLLHHVEAPDGSMAHLDAASLPLASELCLAAPE